MCSGTVQFVPKTCGAVSSFLVHIEHKDTERNPGITKMSFHYGPEVCHLSHSGRRLVLKNIASHVPFPENSKHVRTCRSIYRILAVMERKVRISPMFENEESGLTLGSWRLLLIFYTLNFYKYMYTKCTTAFTIYTKKKNTSSNF